MPVFFKMGASIEARQSSLDLILDLILSPDQLSFNRVKQKV